MAYIDNSMDIIDSRDVIERIEELEQEIEDLMQENEALEEETGQEDLIQNNVDEIEELKEELEPLKELAEEAGASPDWAFGEALIRDSYFIEYAEELANDIYDLPTNWPVNHIDWEEAAEELKQDYICVDFDGVDYWIRA